MYVHVIVFAFAFVMEMVCRSRHFSALQSLQLNMYASSTVIWISSTILLNSLNRYLSFDIAGGCHRWIHSHIQKLGINKRERRNTHKGLWISWNCYRQLCFLIDHRFWIHVTNVFGCCRIVECKMDRYRISVHTSSSISDSDSDMIKEMTTLSSEWQQDNKCRSQVVHRQLLKS